MTRLLAPALLTAVALFLLGASIAEPPSGIWADKDNAHTYAFLKNAEFRFSDGKINAEGVWETSPSLCWLGNKTQRGSPWEIHRWGGG
jgi:hypothetical protein